MGSQANIFVMCPKAKARPLEVMGILASRLAKTCDGVIFNMTTQEWVD